MYLGKSFHLSFWKPGEFLGFINGLSRANQCTREVRGLLELGGPRDSGVRISHSHSHSHFWFVSFASITIPHGLLGHVHHASATPQQA